MKKTIFLGIAVLLALAMFSCGDPSLPKDDEDNADGGITLFGPEFAGGRALAAPTAQAGTNFYEAAFEHSTTKAIVRTTWNYARKGKIQLEPGTYNVILMAGRNADKTLLAVGRPSGIVNNGTTTAIATGITITTTTYTSDLYFDVYPLMNNITSDVTTSTFATATTETTKIFPGKDELGNDVPVFMIDRSPEGAPAVTTATWKFGLGNFPGVTGTPDDQLSITTPVLGPNIIVAAAPQVFVTGYAGIDTLDIPQILETASITGVTPGTTTIGGTFNMSFTSPEDSDGLVQFAFEVPVYGIKDTRTPPANTDKPLIWYIRGGLNNGLIDAGVNPIVAKPGMLGGAIVLGFGNLSAFPIINLNPYVAP